MAADPDRDADTTESESALVSTTESAGEIPSGRRFLSATAAGSAAALAGCAELAGSDSSLLRVSVWSGNYADRFEEGFVSQYEAARDLGASRPRSVLEVVVPQAMPGVIVATVISFAWSVGAYAAPGLLSGYITFAIAVEQRILSDMRYPTAAALSIVMLLLMLASIAVIVAALDRIGGEFELA